MRAAAMLHAARLLRPRSGPGAGFIAFLLLVLWPVLPGPVALSRVPGLAPAGAAADGETPDCKDASPVPFPLEERAKCLLRLGADRWHAAGNRGRGMKIALLDTGFRGYRQHLGKALPAHVTVHSFRADGNLEARDSEHGILCGEVIHSLAPDAELLLANWDTDQPRQFIEAARWARQQGARIISCSVIMPSWSDGEGNGAVHEALTGVLGRGDSAYDVLCFASAGNIAERHWSGHFQDGGNGIHSWTPGVSENVVSPWGNEQVSVELCWQSGCSYELSVYEEASGRRIGRPALYEGQDRCTSVVRFLPKDGEEYLVRVRRTTARGGHFHLVALGGGLRYSSASGSIPFPGDGPEVIAVGAVDANGRRTAYSSCGPNSSHPKPDLVAVVPYPSAWRARPFSGTSAAGPQAAALAALVWASHPDWSAADVRRMLCATAIDLGPVGHDYDTGYGLIHLP